MYFASGESLYLGAVLLLTATIAPAFPKHTWMLRARNLLAWIALALMVMASPPFSLFVSLTFLAVFLLWFITSNQSSPSQVTTRLQNSLRFVLAVSLLVLPAIEFSHRKMARVTGRASDHLRDRRFDFHLELIPALTRGLFVVRQTCGLR